MRHALSFVLILCTFLLHASARLPTASDNLVERNRVSTRDLDDPFVDLEARARSKTAPKPEGKAPVKKPPIKKTTAKRPTVAHAQKKAQHGVAAKKPSHIPQKRRQPALPKVPNLKLPKERRVKVSRNHRTRPLPQRSGFAKPSKQPSKAQKLTKTQRKSAHLRQEKVAATKRKQKFNQRQATHRAAGKVYKGPVQTKAQNLARKHAANQAKHTRTQTAAAQKMREKKVANRVAFATKYPTRVHAGTPVKKSITSTDQAPKSVNAKGRTKSSKRPVTPYMRFAHEMRQNSKDEHPGASFGQMGKVMGSKWKAMSDDDRKRYSV